MLFSGMEPQDIKDLSVYSFSALIQADAAIFGLLAVFVVYQLQALAHNQMQSYNLIAKTTARHDFEQLLLPILVETKHWILMKHDGSPYYSRLLTTAAFTEYWRSNVINASKSTFILIILHVTITSIGLNYSMEVNPVLGIDARWRVIIGLATFVLLLAVISRVGYSFLSKNSYGRVPKTPSIDLASITPEQFRSCSPKNDKFGHLYSIKRHDKSKFIGFKRGSGNTVSVTCLLRSRDGRYVSVRSQEDMDDSNLQSFLQGMKSDPERYWSNT
ncbi:MAG: hypothetical protein KF749_08575 [Bacteroidetes bacterium]|nr:hypothetical protein [Bacteroidota bacterium]MCW5895940.1 hypothetical protein [Bacteroidota bacterium]